MDSRSSAPPGLVKRNAARAWIRAHGGPDFDDTPFFPGARLTVPFGLARAVERKRDGTSSLVPRLRIHNATDRAGAGHVVVPFDSSVEFITDDPRYRDSFGTLLILRPDGADFEIRIAHIDPTRLTPEFIDALDAGRAASHTPIAPAGNMGTSTAPHTHTEIVAQEGTSEILDILVKPFGESEITSIIVDQWALSSGISDDQACRDFDAQLATKAITRLTTQRCVRKDYHTGRDTTFYNSWAAFNGL